MNLQSSEEFSKRVVRNLGELRVKKGVTKASLARLSGVSRAMISMMESGSRSPTVTVVHALATALDISVEELARLASKTDVMSK